jgi:tetratricopeptide (TPR) repeat protein
VIVFATWDEDTFRRLTLPDEAKPGANSSSARALPARGTNYIVVWANPLRRADIHDWGDPNQYLLFEMYTNIVESTRINWLPFWLRTGLARFAGGASVTDTQVKLGRVLPGYASVLRPSLNVPLKNLLSFKLSDIEDVRQQDRFRHFAESWGLVDYFLLAADGRHKPELVRYIQLLQDGRTAEQAVEEAFGDIKALEKSVVQYFNSRGAFPFWEFNVPAAAIQSTLQVRKLDSKEASLAEANVMVRFGNRRGARELLHNVLQQDPNSAAARETLGLCALADANFEEAFSEFAAALQIDPALIEALFYHAMIARHNQPKGKPNEVTERELRQVVAEAPTFAPGLIALARFLAAEYGPSDEALMMARRAAGAEPYLAGYHLTYGYLQLDAGRFQQAQQVARHVMRIAPEGQELDDAQILLDKAVSCEKNGSCETGRPQPASLPEATQAQAPAKPAEGNSILRGVIESTSCTANSKSFILVSQEAKIQFDASGIFVLDLPRTMWIPRELFIPCKHFVGQTVDVRYNRPLSLGGPIRPSVVTLRESYAWR